MTMSDGLSSWSNAAELGPGQVRAELGAPAGEGHVGRAQADPGLAAREGSTKAVVERFSVGLARGGHEGFTVPRRSMAAASVSAVSQPAK
jgi:hypothetical protein